MSPTSPSSFHTSDRGGTIVGLTCPAMVAAIALSVCGGCAAEEDSWLEVGVATDGTRAFIDRKFLKVHGARISGRQQFVLANPDAKGVVRVEQQVVYDCNRGRVFTSRSLEFDGAGKVKRDDILNPPDEDVIQPGTLPQYIYEVLC